LENLEATLKSAAGGREVPVYVSKMGWTTALGAGGVAPSTAADYLSRLYLLAPMYSFIKATSWYDISDDGQDPASVQQNFGLYTYGLAPKPASCAMGEVTRLIAAYRPVSASSSPIGVWIARYSDGANSVFAVWTEQPGLTYNATVSTAGPSGARLDARGICRNANVTGNGSTLLHAVISNSPTLFTTIADSILLQ
jgi:hypothetical protein